MKLHRAVRVPTILLVIFFHPSAFAQNEYEQFVDQKLDELCDYSECFWFYAHLDRFTGSGAEGSSNSHSVALIAGEEYIIFAVCDRDCSDVDLFFYDPAGSLAASDSSVQAYTEFSASNAEIAVEPAYNGTYRLEVKIHSCTATTCYYGADVGVGDW